MLSRIIAAVIFGFTAATVLADGATIVAALEKIGTATANLNTTVVDWDGGLLTALPILTDSATLIGDINDGTQVAQRSANLSDSDAILVYEAVISLSSDVNITLTNIVAAQPKFGAILLTGLVKGDLELTQDATDKLSAAIVAKVPAVYTSIADGVVEEIDDYFDTAIAAYSS